MTAPRVYKNGYTFTFADQFSAPPQPVATTTGIGSAPNPAPIGAAVTVTATVVGANPTGTVNFNVDGALAGSAPLVGSGNIKTATLTTAALSAGAHAIVATYAGDAGNAGSASVALSQQITATTSESTNVALSSTGATASASSQYGAQFPVSSINNGDRKGVNWGAGAGGWNDGTPGTFPDWVQINFNGTKKVDRVDVYTTQDNYNSPIDPTDTTECLLYGLLDFAAFTWDGAAWQPFGAPIVGNTLVKRSITAPAVATNAVRIVITAARAAYARVVEVEAYGVPDSTVIAPPGTLPGLVVAGSARAMPNSSYAGFASGDYARPDYAGMTFDVERSRILFGLGGGHQSSPDIGKDTNIMGFPMASKTWAPLYPSMTLAEIQATTIGPDGLYVSTKQPPARHTYNGTDVVGKWFVVLTNGGSSVAKPCRCDLTAPHPETTWQEVPSQPANPAKAAYGFLTAVAPTADGRELVASYDGGNFGLMHLYDPTSNTVEQLGSNGVFGAWGSTGAFAYFPPNGKHYFLRNDYALFEFSFNAADPGASVATQVEYTGPHPDAVYVTLSYDEVNKTLGGCVANGTYWAVDPVAKVSKKVTLAIEAGSSGVPNTVFHCAARDPATSRLYCCDAGVTWEINPPAFS